MKNAIHPDYKPATIVCSCGNRIETYSTQEEIHVEICAVCHPFYTGRQKLVDTAGRVERFKRKYGATSSSGADEASAAGKEDGAEAEAPAEAESGKPRKVAESTATAEGEEAGDEE